VTVTDGFFAVLLGSINPINESVFSGADRYLTVQVGADPELTPQRQIASVAYAQRIATIDGATGGTVTGNSQITGNLVISSLVMALPPVRCRFPPARVTMPPGISRLSAVDQAVPLQKTSHTLAAEVITTPVASTRP
jgi:hypothetical protein